MKSTPEIAQVFQALADPTRLGILELLRGGERCASDLNSALQMSQPRVARHLKILVDAGLLSARRDGRFIRYTVATGDGVGRLAAAALGALAGLGAAPAKAPRAGVSGERPTGRGPRPETSEDASEPVPDDRPRDIEDFLL